MRATKNRTASVVIKFMEEVKIPRFGASDFVVSGNSGCFTAPEFTKYFKNKGTECRTALAYAPMSNGRE